MFSLVYALAFCAFFVFVLVLPRRAKRCSYRRKQLLKNSLPVNYNPSINFKFCTAAPDAPLPRLSNRATSTACR